MPSSIDPRDARWFQRAVFYEVAVRGFYDSDADGFGDFNGLTERLDYLEWLGIDCLWLLPFYQSPLRDGGYDISDFLTVLPESGNLDDVGMFLEESHRRGMRVIADMVMNHTSSIPGSSSPARTGPTPRPTGTSGATIPSGGPRLGSSSSTPSRPTGAGTRSASSTTGTASSTTSPT
jgi:hypothetical protein